MRPNSIGGRVFLPNGHCIDPIRNYGGVSSTGAPTTTCFRITAYTHGRPQGGARLRALLPPPPPKIKQNEQSQALKQLFKVKI